MCHQEPPRQSFFDPAASVCLGRLCRLNKKCVCVEHEQIVKGDTAFHQPAQFGRRHHQACAGILDESSVGCSICPKDNGQPGHPFPPNQAHLDPLTSSSGPSTDD